MTFLVKGAVPPKRVASLSVSENARRAKAAGVHDRRAASHSDAVSIHLRSSRRPRHRLILRDDFSPHPEEPAVRLASRRPRRKSLRKRRCGCIAGGPGLAYPRASFMPGMIRPPTGRSMKFFKTAFNASSHAGLRRSISSRDSCDSSAARGRLRDRRRDLKRRCFNRNRDDALSLFSCAFPHGQPHTHCLETL